MPKTKKRSKKSRKVEVYIITTSGQGDTYVNLVDKETWDWIFSGWNPPGPTVDAYDDKLCPPAVLERYRKELDLSDYPSLPFPSITKSSYENDRALQAPPVYGDTFFSVGDAMRYIQRQGYVVKDSWEGYVY